MIKITYITHACTLIEVGKTKIITDPWLTGPSWGGTLWHYPTHEYTPSNLPIPDIIFFLMVMTITFMKKQYQIFQKNGSMQIL